MPAETELRQPATADDVKVSAAHGVNLSAPATGRPDVRWHTDVDEDTGTRQRRRNREHLTGTGTLDLKGREELNIPAKALKWDGGREDFGQCFLGDSHGSD